MGGLILRCFDAMAAERSADTETQCASTMRRSRHRGKSLPLYMQPTEYASHSANASTVVMTRARCTKWGQRGSLITGLLSVPTPSTSTSTTSPAFIHTGGFIVPPVPVGVPVEITSPGSSWVKVET